MQCEDIFQDYLVQCPETIKVNAQLDPGETYTWVITDKFGKEHSGETISDADGHLEIPIEDLPTGLLTHYSGSFKLKILSGGVYQNEQCFPIKFLMAKYYDEIVFEVRAGTNVKNNLGCEFDCAAGTLGSGLESRYYTSDGGTNIFQSDDLIGVTIFGLWIGNSDYSPTSGVPTGTQYRHNSVAGTIEIQFNFSTNQTFHVIQS